MSLGPFRVGDSPANDIVITVLDDYDDDLSSYTTGSAVIYDATGTSVATLDAETIDPDGALTFPFPPDPFATPGIYSLAPTIADAGSHSLQLAAIQFVVEPQLSDGWLTLAAARAQLGGDYPADDVVAYTLLQIAQQAVVNYAPALGFLEDGVTPVRPPTNYVQGQLMQARNILNSVKTDPASTSDGDLFVIRPYPLDNFIKQVLRPKQGPLAVVA